MIEMIICGGTFGLLKTPLLIVLLLGLIFFFLLLHILLDVGREEQVVVERNLKLRCQLLC